MSSCATGQCPLQTSLFSYTSKTLDTLSSCAAAGGPCGKKSCNACPAPRPVTAVPTEVVFTPYHQTFGTQDPTSGGDYPRPNFTNYDIFCLKTKLSLTVNSLGASYDTTFTGYEQDGVVRYAVELTEGGRLAPLGVEQARELEKAVQACSASYPRHCLLFSSALPLDYQGQHYPQAWVAGVLPFAQVDESYDPVFDAGSLYVDLGDYEDYLSVWERLHFSLVDQIRHMYRRGYVVCHPQIDSACIENWALSPVLGKCRDCSALYRPEWRDSRFAPCPVSFLRARLGGAETIELRVSPDPVTRHFVAAAFYRQGMGRDFSFSGEFCRLLPAERPLERSDVFLAAGKGEKNTRPLERSDVFLAAGKGEKNTRPLERSDVFLAAGKGEKNTRPLERARFAASLVETAADAAQGKAVTALSALYKEPTGHNQEGETLDEVCYAVEDETAPFVISVLVPL